MAPVAIQNQEPIATNCIIFYILIKVLQLLKAYFVCSLTILTYANCLIRQQKPLFILGSLMHYYLKHNEYQNCKSSRINSLNYYNLFTVTWLRCLRPFNFVCPCNNLYYCNYLYLEASLIKITGIVIKDAVFSDYMLYALKLVLNKLWVFALYLLVVILTVILYFQCRIVLNKVIYLGFAYRG